MEPLFPLKHIHELKGVSITLHKQYASIHATDACARTWLYIFIFIDLDRRARTDTRAPTGIRCHHTTFKPAALQRDSPGGVEAGDAAENHAEPTALLWFNSAAKASPRQAPAHHVMTRCASDSPARSCGLPEETHRQRHQPERRGGRLGGETGPGVCWRCQAAVSPVSTGSVGAVGSDLRRSG